MKTVLTVTATLMLATSAQAFDIGGLVAGAVKNAVTEQAKTVATDQAKVTAKEVAKANGIEGADAVIDTTVDVAADPQIAAEASALKGSSGAGRAFLAANIALNHASTAPKPTQAQIAMGDFNGDGKVDDAERAAASRMDIQTRAAACGGADACLGALLNQATQDLTNKAVNTAVDTAVQAGTNATLTKAVTVEPAAGK